MIRYNEITLCCFIVMANKLDMRLKDCCLLIYRTGLDDGCIGCIQRSPDQNCRMG